MPREDIEINIQRLDIHRNMGNRLRTVNQDTDTMLMGNPYKFCNRCNGSQGIGNMRDRNKTCP